MDISIIEIHGNVSSALPAVSNFVNKYLKQYKNTHMPKPHGAPAHNTVSKTNNCVDLRIITKR